MDAVMSSNTLRICIAHHLNLARESVDGSRASVIDHYDLALLRRGSRSQLFDGPGEKRRRLVPRGDHE
jgi:hypothetical protein